jgi:hypothetical protein
MTMTTSWSVLNRSGQLVHHRRFKIPGLKRCKIVKILPEYFFKMHFYEKWQLVDFITLLAELVLCNRPKLNPSSISSHYFFLQFGI